jgi:hypothetical protein
MTLHRTGIRWRCFPACELTVRSFVIEPSEDSIGLLRVSFSEGVCVKERSVRSVPHPLLLLSALGSIDLLIDKQELIRNKVLKANGLCGSNSMDVSVRRQFKGKIFGFRIKSGTF